MRRELSQKRLQMKLKFEFEFPHKHFSCNLFHWQAITSKVSWKF